MNDDDFDDVHDVLHSMPHRTMWQQNLNHLPTSLMMPHYTMSMIFFCPTWNDDVNCSNCSTYDYDDDENDVDDSIYSNCYYSRYRCCCCCWYFLRPYQWIFGKNKMKQDSNNLDDKKMVILLLLLLIPMVSNGSSYTRPRIRSCVRVWRPIKGRLINLS